MLNWIGECKKIASGVFQTIAQRDQFLPTVDRDQPAKFQIAFELFRFAPKIDNVRVRPTERVERLDVGRCRSIFLSTVHLTVPVSASSIATIRGVGSAPKSIVFFSNSTARDSASSCG